MLRQLLGGILAFAAVIWLVWFLFFDRAPERPPSIVRPEATAEAPTEGSKEKAKRSIEEEDDDSESEDEEPEEPGDEPDDRDDASIND